MFGYYNGSLPCYISRWRTPLHPNTLYPYTATLPRTPLPHAPLGFAERAHSHLRVAFGLVYAYRTPFAYMVARPFPLHYTAVGHLITYYTRFVDTATPPARDVHAVYTALSRLWICPDFRLLVTPRYAPFAAAPATAAPPYAVPYPRLLHRTSYVTFAVLRFYADTTFLRIGCVTCHTRLRFFSHHTTLVCRSLGLVGSCRGYATPPAHPLDYVRFIAASYLHS